MQNILVLYNNEKGCKDTTLFGEFDKQTVKHSNNTISVTFDVPNNAEKCAEKYRDNIDGQFTRIYTHTRVDKVKTCFPNIPVTPYSRKSDGYVDAIEEITSVKDNRDNFVLAVSAQLERISPHDKEPKKEWESYCVRQFERCLVEKKDDFAKFVKDNLKSLDKNQFPDPISLIIGFAYDQKEKNIYPSSSEIIGTSSQIQTVHNLIARAVEVKTALLIQGESGTGKELIARAVHLGSQRKTKPFICLNCAALSETLLESELFGHVKGAFTGATEPKLGKFEVANSGTLFLDEIGEMTPSLQAKMLRVLENSAFERVGGNTTINVDVRIITATNRDLEAEVSAGRFRRDLFFRLRILEIIVPPLRKRSTDIAILAEYFLDRFCKETGRKYTGFTPGAMQTLENYPWPGNVRELKNIIERAVVFGSEPFVKTQDLLLSKLNAVSSEDVTDVIQPQKRQSKSLDELKEELKKHCSAKKLPKGIVSVLENLTILDPLLEMHYNSLNRVAHKWAEEETHTRLKDETDKQHKDRFEKEFIAYYDQIRQWRSTGGKTIREFGFPAACLDLLAETFPNATLASDGIRRIWEDKRITPTPSRPKTTKISEKKT